ncbi:hypothetical protein GOODEAATRI_027140 [Goodea atripinnis]|uniref:Uncharacterized protein n=1 Tax=Goodea atripinnis TaxID=208336 RepID=A0ABV0PSI9_9TELE
MLDNLDLNLSYKSILTGNRFNNYTHWPFVPPGLFFFKEDHISFFNISCLCCHFCRDCRVQRYSFRHLFQKSARNCTRHTIADNFINAPFCSYYPKAIFSDHTLCKMPALMANLFMMVPYKEYCYVVIARQDDRISLPLLQT